MTRLTELFGRWTRPLSFAVLAPLRVEMNQAFESAGDGLAETWPLPLPVLSLDQIWSCRGLRAVYREHGHSLRSDHRAVIADFDFAGPQNPWSACGQEGNQDDCIPACPSDAPSYPSGLP